MRRRQAVRFLRHDDIQEEQNFHLLYPTVQQEIRQIHKLDATAEVRVTQLTFLADRNSEQVKELLRIHNKSLKRAFKGTLKIIGTCILIHVRSSENRVAKHDYVFQAFISLPVTKENHPTASGISSHVHVFSKADFPVAGHLFSVDAAIYSQQNGINSTCAHCCVMMALWHLRKGDYRVSTEQINAIAEAAYVPDENDESKKYFDPRRGLQRKQIRAVCQELQAEMQSVEYDPNDRSESNPTPYELAYLFAESGFPTLILFQSTSDGDFHMVPIIGHTLSADEWFPHAMGHYPDMPDEMLHGKPRQFISSVEWAPHLVAHDDLMGPYYFVGPNIFTSKPIPKGDQGRPLPAAGRVRSVVAVVPKAYKKTFSPIFAQDVGAVFFWSLWPNLLDSIPREWQDRLHRRWDQSNESRFRDVVLRTQIIEPEAYVASLRDSVDHYGKRAQLTDQAGHFLKNHLPQASGENLWLIEFTLPEIFSGNLGKLGEIILPHHYAEPDHALPILESQMGQRLNALPLAMRLLGNLHIYKNDGERAKLDLGFQTHIPLYIRPSKAAN